MKICSFNRDIVGCDRGDSDRIRERSPEGSGISVIGRELLPPVAPSKIVCVGRNYAEHAAELGNEVPNEPLLFLKAPVGDHRQRRRDP